MCWGSSSWITSIAIYAQFFLFIIILLFLFLKEAQTNWGWNYDIPIKFKYLTWDTQISGVNFWACHILLMSFQLHLVFWTDSCLFCLRYRLHFFEYKTQYRQPPSTSDHGPSAEHRQSSQLQRLPFTLWPTPKHNFGSISSPCCFCKQSENNLLYIRVWRSPLFLISFHEKFPASPRRKVVDVRSSDPNNCLASLANTVSAKSVFWLSCTQDTSVFDLVLAFSSIGL